jgi:hypothetical protein
MDSSTGASLELTASPIAVDGNDAMPRVDNKNVLKG